VTVQRTHWRPFLIPLLLTLLAWGLRVVAPEQVPPGWRDDELINIYALSGELFQGRFPLYFTGASGHEPLYHYLHAGVYLLLGENVMGGHFLSIVLGTLTVPLTYQLGRRLFGTTVGTFAALGLATSFWSLIYSRIALRHISLPPFVLIVFFLLWTPFTRRPRSPRRWAVGLGLALGLSLYTYPAARLLPILLAFFGLYLALFHREHLRAAWRGYGLALAIAALLVVPLLLAIVAGRSEAAAQGIGADARLSQLARPIRALQAGDPGPLLETAWLTLNMFHATGDPEWLYNVADRPLFNPVGGLLLWAGLLISLRRWRRPRHFLLLLWFGFGLLPTVLSVPPASLSHSIMIQPLTYLLPVLALEESWRWVTRRFARPAGSPAAFALVALLLFLLPNAWRDLRDYFGRWPRESLVRFLYRADYRDAARYLDARPEVRDWAVGSLLMGPWDRLALQVDGRRDDLMVRLFNPQRALVYVAGQPPLSLLLPSYPRPSPPIERRLQASRRPYPARLTPPLAHYLLTPDPLFEREEPVGRFANGLDLVAVTWEQGVEPAPGREALLVTAWRVAEPLQLPPMPIVANPPPPNVYAGPRLAVFTHLLDADGTPLVGDDGLWVDPLTLRPGDRFLQVHPLPLPPDAPPGPYTVEVGLYDPFTGERWRVQSTLAPPEADRVVLPDQKPTAD